MSFRTTLIVALILVLLGGYAYFIEFKGSEKKKEQEEKQKTLLEVKKDEVAEIRLDGLEQPVKIVSSSNETWQITSPLQARADETAVSRILNQLEKLKYHEIIEEQPKDLASYGLDAPKLTVQIVLKKNLGERSVMVGGRNPVGNLYYLRVNKDPRVYTVEG